MAMDGTSKSSSYMPCQARVGGMLLNSLSVRVVGSQWHSQRHVDTGRELKEFGSWFRESIRPYHR